MWRLCLTTRAYVLCVWEKQILHHHAHAHTQTRARARARAHTHEHAPRTQTRCNPQGTKCDDIAHMRTSQIPYYYTIQARSTRLRPINTPVRYVHTHTHTHTHKHTHTHTNTRARHGHTVSACMHSQRERATTSGVGAGLLHYSFSYSVFREEAPLSPRGNRPVSEALFIYLQFYFHRHTTG